MNPIRVAIIFDQQIQSGGGYQQALNAALLMKEISKSLVEPIYFTTFKENITTLSKFDIEAHFLNMSLFERAWSRIRKSFRNHRLLKLIKKIQRHGQFEKALVQNKIDLVYFLAPSALAQSLEEVNYMVTVWDLCHRDNPEFPEVRSNREFEIRDTHYHAILPRATAVLVDSEISKENLIKRYAIDSERLYVMPFEASVSSRFSDKTLLDPHVNFTNKISLDAPYVFYPAQFWAHKNHVYILEGLRMLESLYNIRVGAIFSGGDKGNRRYIEKYAQNIGLIDRVRFAGFLSNEEVIALYQKSLALVMPSYFGPTNLPPLEAFTLGVPVLYSDKFGLRDQVADAALLMDLQKPETMAHHLKKIMDDELFKSELIEAGYKRLNHFKSVDRLSILKVIFEGYRWRRLCWE
jgi:glycosyltransferase involved in cell wall biosynthesis